MNSIRKGNMPITAIVDNLPFFSAAFEDLFIINWHVKSPQMRLNEMLISKKFWGRPPHTPQESVICIKVD